MKRESKSVASSLEHRLSGYALAASAAGVGMLALAQPAEAKIVYTQADRKIKPGDSFRLDLNHDGVTDFTLTDSLHRYSAFGFATLLLKSPEGNGVQGGSNYAFALNRGARIGPRLPFYGKQMEYVHWDVDSGYYYHGNWLNLSNRYLGVKFKIHAKAHYGWARLNVKAQGLTINAVLTGYAYETIPDKSIIAGKTHGKDVITLQPASLGHLARGASAIPAWRGEQ